MLINKIEVMRIQIFWVELWKLNDKLLSKSSWSFIVLARILPVGVTSNQLKGVFKRTDMSFFWITREESSINLAKNMPLTYKRLPTTIEITINIFMYYVLEISNPFLPHIPNHQSLAIRENCAKIMKKNIKKALKLPAPVKNLT